MTGSRTATSALLTQTLTGDDVPPSAPGAAIYEIATRLGIEHARASRLRLLVEELVNEAQAREHGEREVEVEVRAFVESGRLRVQVRDRGLPGDVEGGASAGLPGELVRLRFVESFHRQTRGPEGNLADCAVAISRDCARKLLRDTEVVLPPDAPEVAADSRITYRAMRADEALGLARLVYRCYHYSYPVEDVYYPERTAAAIESGLLHSIVAVDEEELIVGHGAVELDRPGARVGEGCKLVVDPRYRSRGVSEQLVTRAFGWAAEQGMLGVWSECMTHHPYAQKAQLKAGSKETGLFLGISPAEMQTVQLGQPVPEDNQRTSLVAMYTEQHPAPPRTLYVPERYRAMVRDITRHLGLERTFESGECPALADSRLTVRLERAAQVGTIKVERVGSDLLLHLRQRIDEMVQLRITAIYLDLPLSDPGTGHFGGQLAGLGLFFSALMPELGLDGDVLRFQLLLERIDENRLVLVSDWARTLADFILRDQRRVVERIQSLRISG